VSLVQTLELEAGGGTAILDSSHVDTGVYGRLRYGGLKVPSATAFAPDTERAVRYDRGQGDTSRAERRRSLPLRAR